MATVVTSWARSADALYRYVLNDAAHDDSGQRFWYSSGVGCTPENFLASVRRTRREFGKQNLQNELFHVVQSYRDDELSPDDADAGAVAHETGRKFARKAFPGRQALVVTQKDGKSGLWHNHILVSNVAWRAVEFEWLSRERDEVTDERVPHSEHHAAGRAFTNRMGNIWRVRAVNDSVVAEALGYDNARFVREAGTPEVQDSRADRDRREGGKYVWRDDLRARIDAAVERATDLQGLKHRLMETGVDMAMPGERGRNYGVSFAFVDPDGRQHSARPRGSQGLGVKYSAERLEAAIAQSVARRQAEHPVGPTGVARLPFDASFLRPSFDDAARARLLADVSEDSAVARTLRGEPVPEMSAPGASAPKRAHRREEPTKAPAASSRTPEPREADEASQAAQRAAQAQQAAAVAAPVQSSAWRSRLWGLPPSNRTVRTQQIIDAVAEWEPSARERLQSGGRLDEPAIPKGVGSRFLESYGQYLDPAVRTELEAREETRAQRREQFELEREHEGALQAAGRRPEAERAIYERGVRAQLDTARLRREAIEAAIAEGRYGRADVDGIVSEAEQAEREASARRRRQVAERAAAMRGGDRGSDGPQPGD